MTMKERALKEYENHFTEALYYSSICGYLRNRNLKDNTFIELYMLHNEVIAAIKRILSVTTIKKELEKINIHCAFESQKRFLDWQSIFEKENKPIEVIESELPF